MKRLQKKINPHHLDHSLLKKTELHGIKFNLHSIQVLLSQMKNPQLSYPAIHIAGTNGKGSTAKILSSCLTGCGYKTGLFTSPHIETITERFLINDQPVSEIKLLKILDEIQHKTEFMKKKGLIQSLTFFEICTAAAFKFFQTECVDIAIIETGLGGRLDSTNVLNSKLVILTSIAHDHEAFLGKTLLKIAKEKAGIIHEKANVVIGKIPLKIIQKIEQDHSQSRFCLWGKDFKVLHDTENKNLIYSSHGCFNGMSFNLNLKGSFQLINCSLALKALELLDSKAFCFSQSKMKKILNQLCFKGRFDVVLKKNPLIIFDAAHNLHAVKALTHSLKKQYFRTQFFVICSFCQDKNYLKMIQELCFISDEIILVPLKNKRTFPARQIYEKFKNKKKMKISYQSEFEDAMNYLTDKRKASHIIVCGSFYLLEEAYKWLAKKEKVSSIHNS